MKFLNEEQLDKIRGDLIDSSLTFPQLCKKYNIGYKVLHRIASTKVFSNNLELLKKRKACGGWGLTLNQEQKIEQLILSSTDSFSTIGRKYNVEYYTIEKIAKRYVFQENPEKLTERISNGRFNRESNTIGGYLKAIIKSKTPNLEHKLAKKINEISQEIRNNSKSFGEIGKIFSVEKNIVGKIAKIIVYQNNERCYLERIFRAKCQLAPTKYYEIKEDLLNSGNTFNKIAKKYDESPSIIKKIARNFIFYNNSELMTKRQDCGRLGLPLKKEDEIEKLILTTNRAFADLARQFNCSPDSIRKIAEQYVYSGNPTALNERISRGKDKRVDTSRMKGHVNYSTEIRDQIIDKIKNTNLSGAEISREFGLPQSSIQWIATTQVYPSNSHGYEKRFPRLQKSLSDQKTIAQIFDSNIQHLEAGEFYLIRSVKFLAKVFNAKRETIRKYALQGLKEQFGEKIGYQKYRTFTTWTGKEKIVGTYIHDILERVIQTGMNRMRERQKNIPLFFREISPSLNGLRPDLYCPDPLSSNYLESCLKQEIDADFLPGQTFNDLCGITPKLARNFNHLTVDFKSFCSHEVIVELWEKYCVAGNTLLIIGNTLWWLYGDSLIMHDPDYPCILVMRAELLGRFLQLPNEQRVDIKRICCFGRNHDIHTLEKLAADWTIKMPGWDTEIYREYVKQQTIAESREHTKVLQEVQDMDTARDKKSIDPTRLAEAREYAKVLQAARDADVAKEKKSIDPARLAEARDYAKVLQEARDLEDKQRTMQDLKREKRNEIEKENVPESSQVLPKNSEKGFQAF